MKKFTVIDASNGKDLENQLNEKISEEYELLTAVAFGTGRIAAVFVRKQSTPKSASTHNS